MNKEYMDCKAKNKTGSNTRTEYLITANFDVLTGKAAIINQSKNDALEIVESNAE